MKNAIDKTQGYVLMWRSIMNTAIWSNPKLYKVYSWCVFRANFEPLKEYKGLKRLDLQPGQFVTSYPHAKEELGMAVGTIYNYLALLKVEKLIESKSYSKYTVLTIQNWIELQHPERISETKLKVNRKQNETDNTLNTSNIWKHYIAKFGTKERLLPARQDKISARLKEYTSEQIKQAITNCAAHSFYSTLNSDYIFRSDENIDKLLNLKPDSKQELKGVFGSFLEREKA